MLIAKMQIRVMLIILRNMVAQGVKVIVQLQNNALIH